MERRDAQPRPFFDPSFCLSVIGALKIAQTLGSLITLIAGLWGNVQWEGVYFVAFVSIVAFVASLLLVIMHSFHLTDLMPCVNWGRLEIVAGCIWSVLFVVAGILMAVGASHTVLYRNTWGVSAAFAFITAVVFGVETYLNIKRVREGRSNPAAARYVPARQEPTRPPRQRDSKKPPAPPEDTDL